MKTQLLLALCIQIKSPDKPRQKKWIPSIYLHTHLTDRPAAPALWRTGGWCCGSSRRTAARGPAWGWWRRRCWWGPSPLTAGGAVCWSGPGRWSPPGSPGWSTRSGRALSSRSPTRRSPGCWSATGTCSSPEAQNWTYWTNWCFLHWAVEICILLTPRRKSFMSATAEGVQTQNSTASEFAFTFCSLQLQLYTFYKVNEAKFRVRPLFPIKLKNSSTLSISTQIF